MAQKKGEKCLVVKIHIDAKIAKADPHYDPAFSYPKLCLCEQIFTRAAKKFITFPGSILHRSSAARAPIMNADLATENAKITMKMCQILGISPHRLVDS